MIYIDSKAAGSLSEWEINKNRNKASEFYPDGTENRCMHVS